MTAEQLERLLLCGRAPVRGSHGIGFRVVRELAIASGGDLRVMSAPGVGTRVQIEWPMAAPSWTEVAQGRLEPSRTFAPDRLSGYSGPPRLGAVSRIAGTPGARTIADASESSTGSSQVDRLNPSTTGRPSC
jgi:hypothetical protein